MNPMLLVGAGLMVVALATVVSIMLLRWAGREVREYGVREVDLRGTRAGSGSASGSTSALPADEQGTGRISDTA